MPLPLSIGTPAVAQDHLRGGGLQRTADELLFSAVFDTGLVGQLEPAELEDVWSSGANISWWGGPSPVRPRSADLRHLVTIDLADLDGVLDGASRSEWGHHLKDGLPREGTLSVFISPDLGAGTRPRVEVAWHRGGGDRPHLIASSAPLGPAVGFLAAASYSLPSSHTESEHIRRRLAAAWRGRETDVGGYSYAYGHPRLSRCSGPALLLSLEPGPLLRPTGKLVEISVPDVEPGRPTFDAAWIAVGDVS